MKALVPLALLGVLLHNVSSTYGQDWSPHTAALKKTTFQVESNDGHCSGVLINAKDGYVVTAGHCVPEKADGRSVAVDAKHADVVRLNTVLDLCVLKVTDLDGTALALRPEKPEPGLPISIVGFGFAATRLKFGFGWVSDVRDDSLRGVGDRLYFSATGVVPGDSGGAVVDLSGRLVSITQGALGAGPLSLQFGPPTAVLADFLKPYLPKP
jgi:S1-C subfamily serine protease